MKQTIVELKIFHIHGTYALKNGNYIPFLTKIKGNLPLQNFKHTIQCALFGH